MAWGALIGLGQGLQQVGTMILDDNKQKLAQKLELDKEARAEARADKIFQRDQSTFDHTAVEQSPEGVWMQVDYAKSGAKLDSRLAPANVVTDMNNKAQADKLSLEGAILGNKTAQYKLDNLPADTALERDVKRSQIRENDNTGLAAIIRATPDATPKGTFEDAVDDLVKDTSDIQREYTMAEGAATPLMTASEYRMVVKDAVKAAAQRGVDPRSFLTNALHRYVLDKRSPAGKRALDN